MIDVRETLKKLREEKGKSISQLCKETGISKSSYHAYEKEGRWPSQKTLVSLANYYQTSVDAIVRGWEDPNYHLAKAMHHFHHYFLALKSPQEKDKSEIKDSDDSP